MRDYLGLDSLDHVEVLMAFEDEFGKILKSFGLMFTFCIVQYKLHLSVIYRIPMRESQDPIFYLIVLLFFDALCFGSWRVKIIFRHNRHSRIKNILFK